MHGLEVGGARIHIVQLSPASKVSNIEKDSEAA